METKKQSGRTTLTEQDFYVCVGEGSKACVCIFLSYILIYMYAYFLCLSKMYLFFMFIQNVPVEIVQ
jgi:hypothetical protein